MKDIPYANPRQKELMDEEAPSGIISITNSFHVRLTGLERSFSSLCEKLEPIYRQMEAEPQPLGPEFDGCPLRIELLSALRRLERVITEVEILTSRIEL
jgi:hypothetical protein